MNTLMFFAGVLAGICFLVLISPYPEVMQKKAIDHGCAQYNPQTGNFEWRDNE